jgi:hypothetical protein
MHRYSTTRTRRPGSGAAGLALVALVLGAAAAGATPIDVFFRGPTDASGQEFGIEASLAQAIGYIEPPLYDFTNADGVPVLNILSQNLDTDSIILGPTPSATSSWLVQNNLGVDIPGTTWLVFSTVDPVFLVTDQGVLEIGYDPATTGLRIDPDDGWQIIKATDPVLGDVYYPAITLGALQANALRLFDVTYVSSEPLQDGQFIDQRMLPRLRLALAYAPIPEPGTAVLLGFGLAVLAARSRARS